jgi:hypothetical protein
MAASGVALDVLAHRMTSNSLYLDKRWIAYFCLEGPTCLAGSRVLITPGQPINVAGWPILLVAQHFSPLGHPTEHQ